MATKWFGLAPVLVFAIASPLAAHPQAGDAVARQASTAAAHAGMALGAADLKMVHAHLQHVVNCLVGPSGQGYDAQQADPCKGMGQGAIVDAKGDAARESQLQAALAQAQQGVNAGSLDQAHADAQKAMNTLQAH
jgi:hypothetical protein